MNRWRASYDQGTILLGAAAIFAAAICLGLVANQFSSLALPLFASEESLRPEVPSEVAYVGVSEVSARLEEPGLLLLDARIPDEFALGHLPGAINLYVDDFDSQEPPLRDRLRAATTLVAYCNDMTCDEGARLCARLSAAGYGNVLLMFEGWQGWSDAGHPVSAEGAVTR